MNHCEKMHSGALYLPGDRAIMERQLQCLERLYDFNATRPFEQEKRTALLKEMFAAIGEGCYIEPPFYSSFGGRHVHFGNNIYANFHLTLIDERTSTWMTIPCSAPMSLWRRPGILFCQNSEKALTNTMSPSISEKTVGSGPARSSCRGSLWETIPSSAREAS